MRSLFHEIAPRYDDVTVWLSFGRDAHWKDVIVRMAAVRPGERALDLACGTGDIAARLRHHGARVVGLDVTPRMLTLARAKPELRDIDWACGDMVALPVATGSQHVVTAGYGLRNVPDLRTALRESRRVLMPGGRFLSLDFTLPAQPVVGASYLTYLRLVGGALGRWLHGDADTYRYIAESLVRYPDAEAVAVMMREEGFAHVHWWPLRGGLMAIHPGRVPGR